MSSRTLLICAFLCIASHVEAANILAIFGTQSPSHNIIHMSVAQALINVGHNLTVVTQLPLKDTNPKYHHILIPPQPEDQQRLNDLYHRLGTAKSRLHYFQDNFGLLTTMNDLQQKMLKDPAFRELLDNKGNHFDLLILGYGYNDYFFGVADHFKCPIIVSWINLPFGVINELVGNPEDASYIPLPYFGPESPMGFFKRVSNLVFSKIFRIMFDSQVSVVKEYYKTHFPAERGYRPLAEMQKNVSLIFCSTFFSEGPVRPYVQNFIEIGGIQAKEEPDPLPEDLEEFIETADDGVIFFSMGSNVKSTSFDANATQVIFNVLAGRKEKVLWKWDVPDGPGKSPNIMYRKWMPQDDILAHPKVKLFITHGGKGSITESQYHGVPMLALPIFGDQFGNANLLKFQGYGLFLDHHTMTEEEFRAHLEEVLYNSTYYDAIKQYSSLYRDRPMTARKSVVYWTEYVMRHHGAKHMQSPRVHLNFWQQNSLDVIGFLLMVIGVVLFGIKYCLRLVRNLLFGRSKEELSFEAKIKKN